MRRQSQKRYSLAAELNRERGKPIPDKEVFLSGRSGVVERLRRFFLGLGRGEHTNEVIHNVDLLFTVSAGLVRGVYVDTLYKLVDKGRGQRVDFVVLLHQCDKLRHVDSLGLSLVQFSV